MARTTNCARRSWGCWKNRAKLNRQKTVKTERAMSGILRKLDALSCGRRELKLALLDKAISMNWLTASELKAGRNACGQDGGQRGAAARLGVWRMTQQRKTQPGLEAETAVIGALLIAPRDASGRALRCP